MDHYRNEPYFPGDGGIVAQGEAKRAAESARYSAEMAGKRAAEAEEMATKGLARADERITDVRWALSDLTSRMQDLEHQARVLFAQDEAQVAEIEMLKGQASEVASVVVGLSKRLDASQEVQIEMIKCLAQLREALIAIGEHVASMEAGGKDVMRMVEGILSEKLEGFHEDGEEGEESVGLPYTTKEFMEAVDVLCMKFRIYNEEAEVTFDYSSFPPTIKPEWQDDFNSSGIKEERQHFAEAFHGKITEAMFRKFMCENLAGKGFPETNRIFYHKGTKQLFNPIVEMVCDAMIEQDNNIEQHPGE